MAATVYPESHGSAQRWPAALPPEPALDVTALRHPYEPSRFALLIVGYAVVIAGALVVLALLGRLEYAVVVVLGVAAVVLLAWFGINLHRVGLLASAVRVTPQTFPDAQAVIDDVRRRLDFHDPIDVFVVDKQDGIAALVQVFRNRIVLVEGDAVTDLANERNRIHLAFFIGTLFGRIKTQHARWNFVLHVLDLAGLQKIATPFVRPWRRATVYTGDRLALLACGSLAGGLEAIARQMVGKAAVASLRPEGLLPQAVGVRRKLLVRWFQLSEDWPFPTNRYLELLAFAAVRDPGGVAALRDRSVDAGAVDGALAAVPRRTAGNGGAVGVAAVFAVGILVAGAAAGVALRAPQAPVGPVDVLPSSAEPSGEPTDVTTPVAEAPPTGSELLLATVPSDLSPSCGVGAGAALDGLTGHVHCVGGPVDDAVVDYYSFDTSSAMQAAFDAGASGYPSGDCASGYALTTWSSDGVVRGRMTCLADETGSVLTWTVDDDAVVVQVSAPTNLQVILDWWLTHAHLQS